MAHEENCEGELFQTEGPRLLGGFSIIWLTPYGKSKSSSHKHTTYKVQSGKQYP
uniref:OSJNBb0088C09.2 protein n=1 Tax=Oryza sativa subsp. japonica TaxID=39947 RepID=Q7XJY9_ORYSJ|nr:OSJNBb0088C09.2 [Oryza sativa Japonica Group]